MDLAYFNRSKKRFACWIGLPPVIIAIVLGVSTYSKHQTDKAMATKHRYLQLIPSMESKLEDGKKTLGGYWNENTSIDSLNTAVNRYASESGLLVSSLTTALYQPRGGVKNDKVETTEFKLTARGSMVSVMKFFNTIHTEQPVLSITKSTISFAQMDPTPQYQVELIFHYQKVSI